jgi:hypothetical protein
MVITALIAEGITDMREVESGRVWWSPTYKVRVKLQGTTGHVNLRVIVQFCPRS